MAAAAVTELRPDGGGHTTWRSSIVARLAGRQFGAVQVDVSPRGYELMRTDTLPLRNSLAFAGIEAPDIEVIDSNRHAAEKFHAMLRDFGDRENTRVRDLVDLVILVENRLIDRAALASAVRDVWLERNASPPPTVLPELPAAWRRTYEALAVVSDLTVRTFTGAVDIATALWADLHRERS